MRNAFDTYSPSFLPAFSPFHFGLYLALRGRFLHYLFTVFAKPIPQIILPNLWMLTHDPNDVESRPPFTLREFRQFFSGLWQRLLKAIGKTMSVEPYRVANNVLCESNFAASLTFDLSRFLSATFS